jgi:hypothetical protein
LSWGNQNVHVWNAFTVSCELLRPVWCVEDRLTTLIYLPSVLRSYAGGAEGP